MSARGQRVWHPPLRPPAVSTAAKAYTDTSCGSVCLAVRFFSPRNYIYCTVNTGRVSHPYQYGFCLGFGMFYKYTALYFIL